MVMACAYASRAGMRPRSAGRREELERNSIRIAEGNPGAVVGVLYSAVRNAQLVQACGPRQQLTAITAGEGNMIQAGAMLVEYVTCSLGMRMQAEQLPSTEREHGVMKAPSLLVLVENGLGGQQLAVPASASIEISHRHGDMGDRRKLRHSGLLTDGGNVEWLPMSYAGLLTAKLQRTDVDHSSCPASGPIMRLSVRACRGCQVAVEDRLVAADAVGTTVKAAMKSAGSRFARVAAAGPLAIAGGR